MIAEALKKALLQAAIQGKLTEQLPGDGDARALLKEIQKEKVRLINEGKIKKQKPLPEITEDEIPFDIPENWVWVRLEQLCSLLTDGTHKTPRYVEKGVPFLSIQNISKGKFDFSKIKYITEIEHRVLTKRCKPERGDILFCRIGTLGKPLVNTLEVEFSIFVSLALIKTIDKRLNDFIVHYLSSPSMDLWIDQNKVGGGTHTNKINLRDLNLVVLPLPPLTEQSRIVKTLEDVLIEIDKLAIDETKLDNLENTFPNKVRSSILQAAIQGKLTQQLPEDGDARELLKEIQKEKARLIKEGKIKKQKPLPAITEDEIPFDIPENWAWVRLGDVVMNARSGGTPDTKTSKYYGGSIPFVTIKDMTIAEKYIDATLSHITELGLENSSAWLVEKDHILYSMYASIGKVSINTIPLATSQAIIALKLIDNETFINYIYFYLRSLEALIYRFAAGTTQLNINAKIVKELLVPLPPLLEQKRINEKLDELLPLCEQLE